MQPTVKQNSSRRAARHSSRDRAVVPASEAVKQLNAHLGRRLLAITLGVDPTSVDRYVRGEKIRHDIEKRIIDAHAIWLMVSAVESPEMTRAWWMGMKDGLDDLSPAEAIADDRVRDVRAVARYFVEAG